MDTNSPEVRLSDRERLTQDAALGMLIMDALVADDFSVKFPDISEEKRLNQVAVAITMPIDRVDGVLKFYAGNRDPKSELYNDIRVAERFLKAVKLSREEQRSV
ncbi:hypothetical protein A2397_05405 [Candidatus Amesbacteria bacterium RIFOXYB1_FULL_44_23]|uniref:Uncharacterized protein n=1 Tax=Candidatus Amesbacteria bacterium RIFOXYB1_FULL_44_23 TaxID=1797263 RepID=A0A1F4ZR48_9BACT|nr:MAG: hypothetical protein A2397_05405 [Candidatus Amesbacteria bacterium RIFOXYB1_FULL_44_23]